MCQAHHIYLDLDDTQLLQMQDSLFCSAVCPDVDHMPISVFFGQALPFAPVFYDVQHCVQHFQVANFRWLPLFGRVDNFQTSPKFAIGLVSSFFAGFSLLFFTSYKTPVSLYLSCAFQPLPYFGTRISTP